MIHKNNWNFSFTAFNNLFVFPENNLEWKSIGNWIDIWNNSWEHNGNIITNRKPFCSQLFLNEINYFYQKKSLKKRVFKKMCLEEISEKSFPTFFAIVIFLKEYNILKNINNEILDDFDLFDKYLFDLKEHFSNDKPQIHQIVIFLIMKITKILNNTYSFEEFSIDKKELKNTISLVNTSIKMAINDLSIHKYNMTVKDVRLIEFEYDILIQFTNMLSNCFVISLVDNNEKTIGILNEIGIFEHKMEVIGESLHFLEDEWLKNETIKSLKLFIEVCFSLKNFKANDKIIVQKVNSLKETQDIKNNSNNDFFNKLY